MADAPPPDTVVFDLGGVLIDWNPRHLYRKLFAREDAMEEFLAEVCTGAWNVEQDRGRPFAEATALLVERHPHHRAMIEAYFDRWTEMLNGPIHGTVAVLEELHGRGVPLFALTNWSAETWPRGIEAQPRLADAFGVTVVSGQEGTLKPGARIFETLCDRAGVAPEDCVFIDDGAHNIAGAEAVGMDGIHFTGPAALRNALAERGLV